MLKKGRKKKERKKIISPTHIFSVTWFIESCNVYWPNLRHLKRPPKKNPKRRCIGKNVAPPKLACMSLMINWKLFVGARLSHCVTWFLCTQYILSNTISHNLCYMTSITMFPCKVTDSTSAKWLIVTVQSFYLMWGKLTKPHLDSMFRLLARPINI